MKIYYQMRISSSFSEVKYKFIIKGLKRQFGTNNLRTDLIFTMLIQKGIVIFESYRRAVGRNRKTTFKNQ